MSLIEIKLPDIGELKTVPVVEIVVGVGDEIKVDDPLIIVESDKATIEVPAPEAGRVAEMLVKVGDTVSQGATILKLEAAGGAAAEREQTPSAQAAYTPLTAPGSDEAKTPDALASSPVGSSGLPAPRDFDGAHASPSVRRIARELGLDLAQIKGTGEKGRITKEDLKRGFGGVAGSGTGIPEIPAQDFSKFGPIEERKLTRLKKFSGPHLHRAWLNVPHVTHTDEADITELEVYRKQLDAAGRDRGYRVTLLSFLLKASVSALKDAPEFNASLSPDLSTLILKRYYNIGVAVDTPDGLVVPVIKDVERKGIVELSQELVAVSARMREGRIQPSDIAGGTFSISSLGGIGGTSFTPIVNAPEVAILGVVRSVFKPVWNGSTFDSRLMLPLCLSYDHRVIDGASAARFTERLVDILSDVRQLVL